MNLCIVWDWNGTLRDDVKYAQETTNSMLKCRGKKSISYDYYQAIFSFPIKDYYKKIGFEFANHKEYLMIVDEFNEMYRDKLYKCKLFDYSRKILQYFAEIGCT